LGRGGAVPDMRKFKYERDIIKAIREIYTKIPNHYLAKFNVNIIAGFPDIMAAFNPNKVIFLEVKREDGMFTPIQMATLKQMRRAGLHAYGLLVENSEKTHLIDFELGTCNIGTLYENCYDYFRKLP
jgi:hypothetical protein